MEGYLVCSRKEKIPLFKLSYNSEGHKIVEYGRKGCTEPIEVISLIDFLVREVRKNPGKMIYSPDKHIPLGMAIHVRDEIYCIEVKFGRRKDIIRLSTYVALLLESEALKAS